MIRCVLFGHDPRGPIMGLHGLKIVYRCRRCHQLIEFMDRGGWKVVA